jgi:hypothetical protein
MGWIRFRTPDLTREVREPQQTFRLPPPPLKNRISPAGVAARPIEGGITAKGDGSARDRLPGQEPCLPHRT